MDTATYQARRTALRESVSGGYLLLLGNLPAPRNYEDNIYPFRQDSHFLYFVGARQPGMALLIGPDGDETLFGPAADPDDVVWSGPQPGMIDHAGSSGIDNAGTTEDLSGILAAARKSGAPVHYLPPYRDSRRIQLAGLLDVDVAVVDTGVSTELAAAVVALRNVKSDEEIRQIENALSVSALMYQSALGMTAPGRGEAEVAAMMQGVALLSNRPQSFPPIVSVRGEVLHNESYENTLAKGDLLLIDSGTESPFGYASDITRTYPVAGVFSPRQREIYDVVLGAQQTAIQGASPRLTNRELHLMAARTIVSGLHDVGLMKGDVDEAVAAGAHALFFPHGLGHMLGLDVHDMEDLGDLVGYAPGESRSDQFGLNYLRLARKLEPGFVITVEPGIYFIPALIDRWRAGGRHEAFIDYAKVQEYRDFGGIRIEDDVLITGDGCRVLGAAIPKTAEDIELVMSD